MALQDYQDPYGYDQPYDEPYTEPPAPSAPAQPNRRQQIIDGYIIPDFTAIAGRPPTPDEINQYYDVYERAGGDEFRSQVQARFPAATGGGGGGGTLGTLAIPSNYRPYDGPMSIDLSGLPEAPKFAWTPTSEADVLADPSYGFRFKQGEGAYRNNRAAAGASLTGGTLKGLIDYGQNFASQEFANVDSRRFRDAMAAYTPQFNAWQKSYDTGYDARKSAFDRAWEAYQFGANDDYRRGTYNADDAWRRDNAILNAGAA